MGVSAAGAVLLTASWAPALEGSPSPAEEPPQAMAWEQLHQGAADPPSPAPAAKHQEKKANSSGAECFLSITRPAGGQAVVYKTTSMEAGVTQWSRLLWEP